MVDQGAGKSTADLTRHDKHRLEQLRDFLGSDVNSTRQLELIASLHYLKKATKGRAQLREIILTFREKKPQFTEQEITDCWQRLEAFDAIAGQASH